MLWHSKEARGVTQTHLVQQETLIHTKYAQAILILTQIIQAKEIPITTTSTTTVQALKETPTKYEIRLGNL